jgi:hypothetical protein
MSAGWSDSKTKTRLKRQETSEVLTDLLGETSLPTYFKASKVRDAGLARYPPRPREQERRRDAARANLEGGWHPPTRPARDIRGPQWSHPARGVVRSLEPCAGAFGQERMHEPSGLGGSEGPRRGRSSAREARNPGEQRPPSRDPPGRCERIHGGNKASKWMRLAERGGSGGSSPRVAGKRVSARRKGAHSRQGIQATTLGCGSR